jgi:nitrite reductase (NO-forming)
MSATIERPRTNGARPTLPPPPRRPVQHDSGGYWAAFALLLGLLVGVLGFIAVWMGVSAHDARNDARKAAHSATVAAPAMGGMHSSSYAGAAPANAAALAAAHIPRSAVLPPAPAGAVARVQLVLQDKTISIAPGIRFNAWAFDGVAPAPFIHVRQGQRVEITLTNNGAIPHSIDFHAARVAPNIDFRDVPPGGSIHFSFVANDPGAFMFHCGTKPVLMHIATGMYGAIIVEPRAPLPPAQKQYVLVASEWYLDSPGFPQPANIDMTKAQSMMPDWATWNGYAAQYVTHPLVAQPGDTVRFWVVDAGPSLNTDFHVVGTLLNRAWVNGDMTQYERNVQTALVPAGGGAVFDIKIDKPGLYPFVSHSFAAVDLGQVGVLKVGNVAGTMSH